MRVYKKMIIVAALIAIVSFLVVVILHYCCPCYETEFWINVCLGLFGSAALTVLTSVLSYNHEKIKTLEDFFCHTQQLIYFVNKYQEQMTLEQKIQFFLSYSEFDKLAWDSDFRNLDFFFECKTKDREYIYYSIYKPIIDFNDAVTKYVWNFRWHLDGSGKNDAVMQKFVEELQGYLLKIVEQEIPKEYDENGKETSFMHCKSTSPKLVLEVQTELTGPYYEIMYGNRHTVKEHKLEEE